MAKPYKRKHSKFWWVVYWSHGRKIRQSTGKTSFQDAKQFLKEREGEIAKGEQPTTDARRLRFDEAVNDVAINYRIRGQRSLPDVESRIKNHLLPYFGGRRMADVTSAQVSAYAAKRLDDGAAAATVNRELSVIKRAFVLAVRGRKLTARPYIEMLPENNARQGFFEPSQFEAVRRHLPEAVQRLVTFECITGWRNYSEVYPMQWSWVDFDGSCVRLPPGIAKNREGRMFPFTDELRTLLLEQRAHVDRLQRELGRIIPHCWCWDDGRRVRDFREAWRQATIAAGCPGRLMHDFRRTAVRNMEQSGIPRSVATKMTGHKTESVYLRYAIVAEADMHREARKLDARPTGTQGK